MRRKTSRRRAGMTLPIAMIAGMAPYVGNTLGEVKASGWAAGLRNSVKYIAPYDPATGQWTAAYLGGGLLPIIVGWAVHKFVGPMINRTLSLARVPLIRL